MTTLSAGHQPQMEATRNPDISVVIPTHKRRDFLARAIASVCLAADTASLAAWELEIVVADDGHTAETEALCLELAGSIGRPLRYARTIGGPSCGPAAGRNLGVSLAHGRFIYFLDDDDEFLPARFQWSLPLLRTGKWDIVLERTLRVFADGSGQSSYISGPQDRFELGAAGNLHYLLYFVYGDESNNVTTDAMSFTKESFERVGGVDEGLRFGQDGEFLLRMGTLGRPAFRGGDPIAVAYRHASNHSAVSNQHYYNNILCLRQLYNKVASVDEGVRSLVAKFASDKLDFALTRYRMDMPNYSERFWRGAKALRNFPWQCVTTKNMRSIVVWLLWPRSGWALRKRTVV